MELGSSFVSSTRNGPVSARQTVFRVAAGELRSILMSIAESLGWDSGIEGGKRTDSPFTASRRKEGPVAAMGRRAEQLADASTAKSNTGSKPRLDSRCASPTQVRTLRMIDTTGQKFPRNS